MNVAVVSGLQTLETLHSELLSCCDFVALYPGIMRQNLEPFLLRTNSSVQQFHLMQQPCSFLLLYCQCLCKIKHRACLLSTSRAHFFHVRQSKVLLCIGKRTCFGHAFLPNQTVTQHFPCRNLNPAKQAKLHGCI